MGDFQTAWSCTSSQRVRTDRALNSARPLAPPARAAAKGKALEATRQDGVVPGAKRDLHPPTRSSPGYVDGRGNR